MKKLFLLLFVLGAGFSVQAQEDWTKLTEVFDRVYSLATDLGEQTDKVTAAGNVISIITGKGTVSVQKKLDKSKPKHLNHYQYSLLTTTGRSIQLDKMNAERVIETFQAKLLELKTTLAENQDADVSKILDSLFQ
ncbi:hypothetical protein J8281_03945 [Aquimarina sp. U1-2]|uniref:hypothetical protein n=1 Tax=Aquimarina sp. U1-2 TaxID=2823141 RepID=UPI001AED0A43|nr:hypothetical protein [Aquimarina sp. U1-2]MBP2831331.1 hypothetical protein [Aquimarina sp. U1-2]